MKKIFLIFIFGFVGIALCSSLIQNPTNKQADIAQNIGNRMAKKIELLDALQDKIMKRIDTILDKKLESINLEHESHLLCSITKFMKAELKILKFHKQLLKDVTGIR